jgi:hypothetical protein
MDFKIGRKLVGTEEICPHSLLPIIGSHRIFLFVHAPDAKWNLFCTPKPLKKIRQTEPDLSEVLQISLFTCC